MMTANHKAGASFLLAAGAGAVLCTVFLAVFAYQIAGSKQEAMIGIMATGLLALLVLSLIKPAVPLILTIVFLASPIPLVADLQSSAYITSFLMAGCALGVIVQSRTMRPVDADPLYKKMWIFLGYGAFTLFFGVWAGNRPSLAVGDFFQVVELAFLYILVCVLIKDKPLLDSILRWVFISAMVTIFLQLVLFAVGGMGFDWLPTWEGSGNENLFRTIDTNAIFIFAVLLNLVSQMESSRRRFWVRILLAATLLNILLSLSRGEWLATFVAVLVSLALPGNRNRKKMVGAFASILLVLGAAGALWKISSDSRASILNVFQERVSWGATQVQEGLEGTSSLATRRFIEFVIVAPQVVASPIVGKGLGATYEIGGFAVLNADSEEIVDNHFIHNLLLVLTFRMGLIGLVLFFWILYRYFRAAITAYKETTVPTTKAMIGGLLAGIAGQLLLSMTEPTLLSHPKCGLAACAMALTFRLRALEGEPGNAALSGQV